MQQKKGSDPISPRSIAIGAVTDEFSPDNLDRALGAMADLGMTFAELRVVDGKNIIDHSDDEVDDVCAQVEARGMRVLSIASPVLKCTLPDAPPIAPHIQQDMFSSAFAFDDQPRLARRAFEIAERTGARIVRVFSYWRTVDPDGVFRSGRLCAVASLPRQPRNAGLIIGIENEHACNIATGAETARLLAAVDHPRAAGHLGSGECARRRRNAVSGRLRAASDLADRSRACEGLHRARSRARRSVRSAKWEIDWRGQIAALARDGYRRTISLETHWKGPDGDKFQGSIICGRNLTGERWLT